MYMNRIERNHADEWNGMDFVYKIAKAKIREREHDK